MSLASLTAGRLWKVYNGFRIPLESLSLLGSEVFRWPNNQKVVPLFPVAEDNLAEALTKSQEFLQTKRSTNLLSRSIKKFPVGLVFLTVQTRWLLQLEAD